VAFALFDSEASFDSGDSPLRAGRVGVTDGACVWSVEVPRGAYALKVYHDVNGNGRLDTGRMGIPKEPYGFSNGARGRFGPPSFGAARFELDEARSELVIDLH